MNSTTRNEHQFFCPKCRRLLPLSLFYQYKNGRRSGYCKRCTSMLTADRIRKKREDPVFRAKEAAQRRERYRNDEAFRQRDIVRHRLKRLPKECPNCTHYPCFDGIENISSNLALTCHSYKVG